MTPTPNQQQVCKQEHGCQCKRGRSTAAAWLSAARTTPQETFRSKCGAPRQICSNPDGIPKGTSQHSKECEGPHSCYSSVGPCPGRPPQNTVQVTAAHTSSHHTASHRMTQQHSKHVKARTPHPLAWSPAHGGSPGRWDSCAACPACAMKWTA